ncbi:MAG: hypothetical protein ABIH01_00870, partial [Candidatus Omnitrophota bacterium]
MFHRKKVTLSLFCVVSLIVFLTPAVLGDNASDRVSAPTLENSIIPAYNPRGISPAIMKPVGSYDNASFGTGSKITTERFMPGYVLGYPYVNWQYTSKTDTNFKGFSVGLMISQSGS